MRTTTLSTIILSSLGILVACPGPPEPRIAQSCDGGTGLSLPSGLTVRLTSGPDVSVLAVADKGNDRISVFANDNCRIMMEISTGRDSADKLLSPSDVTITQQYRVRTDPLDPDSLEFIVSDNGNDRVVVFDAGGRFIREFGRTGVADGEFSDLSGIDIDNRGNIYVADKGNHRVQVFDSTGAFVTKWGGIGLGPGRFSSPTDVSVQLDRTGAVASILVSDSGNNRVQIFDSTGAYKFSFNGIPGPKQLDAIHVGVTPASMGYVTTSDNSIIVLGDGAGLDNVVVAVPNGIVPYGIDGLGLSSDPFSPTVYITDYSNGELVLLN